MGTHDITGYTMTKPNGCKVFFVEDQDREGGWIALAQPWDSATQDWDTASTVTEQHFTVCQLDGDDADWRPSLDEVIEAYRDAAKASQQSNVPFAEREED